MCYIQQHSVFVCIRENREFRSWGTAAARRRMLREVPGDYLRDDVLRLCDCVCVRVFVLFPMRLIRAENDSDIAPAWDICGGGSGSAAGRCGGKIRFPGAHAYSRQKSLPPRRRHHEKRTHTYACKGLERMCLCLSVLRTQISNRDVRIARGKYLPPYGSSTRMGGNHFDQLFYFIPHTHTHIYVYSRLFCTVASFCCRT